MAHPHLEDQAAWGDSFQFQPKYIPGLMKFRFFLKSVLSLSLSLEQHCNLICENGLMWFFPIPAKIYFSLSLKWLEHHSNHVSKRQKRLNHVSKCQKWAVLNNSKIDREYLPAPWYPKPNEFTFKCAGCGSRVSNPFTTGRVSKNSKICLDLAHAHPYLLVFTCLSHVSRTLPHMTCSTLLFMRIPEGSLISPHAPLFVQLPAWKI